MTKNIIPLAIGAVAGGVFVYWWIKRTCPCQQETPAAAAAAAAPPRVASASSGADGELGDLGDVGELDDFDQPAVVLAGDLPRMSTYQGTYQSAPSSSSAASPGCTTCGA